MTRFNLNILNLVIVLCNMNNMRVYRWQSIQHKPVLVVEWNKKIYYLLESDIDNNINFFHTICHLLFRFLLFRFIITFPCSRFSLKMLHFYHNSHSYYLSCNNFLRILKKYRISCNSCYVPFWILLYIFSIEEIVWDNVALYFQNLNPIQGEKKILFIFIDSLLKIVQRKFNIQYL